MQYHLGETIICCATVRDAYGELKDPSTSMKIIITDDKNGIEVDNQSMVKDSTGVYHYDWTPSASSSVGIYYIYYEATDGTRISIAKDRIELT